MARDQIAVVLDPHLAFERRRGQISQLRHDAADHRDRHALRNEIRLRKPSEDPAEQHTAEHAADRALFALFRAQMRAEFVFADRHADEIGHDVRAERRQEYQPDQIAVRRLVDEHDMERKEHDIENAQQRRCHVFQFAFLDIEAVDHRRDHGQYDPDHDEAVIRRERQIQRVQHDQRRIADRLARLRSGGFKAVIKFMQADRPDHKGRRHQRVAAQIDQDQKRQHHACR